MLTPRPWKLESILQLLLGVFGAIAFSGIYAQLLGFQPAPGELHHGMMLVAAFSVQGVGLLWLNWFFADHRLTWARALDFRWRVLPAALFGGVLVGVGGFYLCSQLGALMAHLLNTMAHWFDTFHLAPEPQTIVQALNTSVSVPWLVMLGVMTIVLAPIVEETIFRGILFTSIRQAGFPKVAWIGTALLFGISHANLQAFVPLTVLAAMLAWIYLKTDSLLAPIIAHATFNAINFLLAVQQGALGNAAQP